MAPSVEPTFFDKLLLVPHIAKVLGAVFYRLVTFPFSQAKANKPLKDIVFAAARAHLASISVAQEQWTIATDTQASYLEIAKKENFQPETTTILNSGLKLHWLGAKASKKVLVYFHGGGYALPCTTGHVQWLFDLQKELSKTSSISVILVHYTLTPHAVFPGQLRQAAETLAWLTGKFEKKPSDIVLAGDSAGGNMTLGLLSHLLHPHPEATKIELTEPLATAVLISPWIKFSTDDDSFKRNATSDMLPPAAADRWSSMFLSSKTADEYSEAIRADTKWFSGLDNVVKDILVWGGGAEVLIDSINQIGKTLQSAHPRTEIVVQQGAAHEDFLLDVVLGYPEKAEGTKVIETWLKERV